MSDQLPLDLAFDFEGHPIHPFLHNGQPAWETGEVAAALGMADAAKGVRESPITEKGLDYDVAQSEILPWKRKNRLQGQSRAVTILYESGLYALVLRSNKPAAMRFTRWVVRDVLPEIRATGSFSLARVGLDRDKLEPGTLIKLLDQERKGSRYARDILDSLGLRPAEGGGNGV